MFLLQILVLLAVAKILGRLFQRRGWPALAGEAPIVLATRAMMKIITGTFREFRYELN